MIDPKMVLWEYPDRFPGQRAAIYRTPEPFLRPLGVAGLVLRAGDFEGFGPI